MVAAGQWAKSDKIKSDKKSKLYKSDKKKDSGQCDAPVDPRNQNEKINRGVYIHVYARAATVTAGRSPRAASRAFFARRCTTLFTLA